MEFDNLHDHVSWLTSELQRMTGGGEDKVAALEVRVATLEGRLSAADGLARAAMAEIKEHEAETDTLSQPATAPVAEVPDGKTDNEVPEGAAQ